MFVEFSVQFSLLALLKFHQILNAASDLNVICTVNNN